MKVVGLHINWRNNWANDPDIALTIDGVPPYDEAIWEAIPQENGSIYYWSIQEGLLHAFMSTRDHSGFGGHTFTCKIKDGSIQQVTGPWDCGTRTANQLLEKSFVNIAYHELEDPFPSEHSVYFAGMMDYEVLQPILHSFNPYLTLVMRGAQTTGLGDQQSTVIQHGNELNVNTIYWELPKAAKDLVGYQVKSGGPNGYWDIHYSVWGQSVRR